MSYPHLGRPRVFPGSGRKRKRPNAFTAAFEKAATETGLPEDTGTTPMHDGLDRAYFLAATDEANEP